MGLFFGWSCLGHAGHMIKEGQVGLEMYKRSLEKWSIFSLNFTVEMYLFKCKQKP